MLDIHNSTLATSSWKQHNVTYSLCAHTYITNCVSNLESMCNTIFKPASVPFDPNYHAELDTADLCSPSDVSRYRPLLGSANWMITLGPGFLLEHQATAQLSLVLL